MDNRTWFDQRPSHNPVPQSVRVAQEKYDIAQKVYDEAIDYCLDNDGWDQPHLDDLAHIVDEAYKNQLEAKHQALNCPHQNTTTSGIIQFIDGAVDDNIQTVCDDCDKVVG